MPENPEPDLADRLIKSTGGLRATGLAFVAGPDTLYNRKYRFCYKLFSELYFTKTKTSPPILPTLERILAKLGERLRSARLRRNLTTQMVAERAGISLPTLRQIEQGKSTPSLGAYSQVLLVLGLETDLDQVAKDDPLGQHLQDARLPQRARRPRKRGADVE